MLQAHSAPPLLLFPVAIDHFNLAQDRCEVVDFLGSRELLIVNTEDDRRVRRIILLTLRHGWFAIK